jgi:hypothetical protein
MARQLSDYQRVTLARQCDAWGDQMVRMTEEKPLNRHPDKQVWIREQAAAWYEIATEIRCRRGVK